MRSKQVNRSTSWFSPFITSIVPKKAELQPIKVGLSLTEDKATKTLRLVVKDREVLAALGEGKYAEMRAVKHNEQCYLTIRLVNAASEGRAIRYATYLQIQATNLTFLPLEPHKRKEIPAFFSTEENALLVVLPDDYRPRDTMQLN